MRRKMILGAMKIKETAKNVLLNKHHGINGIVVAAGLCIIALLLCVVMKDTLTTFVNTIGTNLLTKANTILGS